VYLPNAAQYFQIWIKRRSEAFTLNRLPTILSAVTLVKTGAFIRAKEGPAKPAEHIKFYVSNCLVTGFKNPDLFFNICRLNFCWDEIGSW
jgi:hypothetical protein